MATAQGYGKTVTSGSIFAYDVGDTRNSLKGEPTTNVATGTLYPYTPYNTMTRDGQNLTFTMVGSSALYLTVHNGTNYNGQIITLSGYMFKNGVPYALPYPRANTYHTVAAIEWHFDNVTGYFEIVENCNASSVWLFHTPSGASGGDVITIKDFQVEVKSHATPFVNGTRSTTQGLIDLTGNSSIDLANVSFDSNAQMTFDGTDDVITVPMQNLKPTLSITQEVVVYINSNTTQVFIGAQYGTSSGNSYALWLNGANNLAGGVNIGGSFNYQSQTYTITTSKWYHFIHTYDGTDQKLYVNGVVVRSWPTAGTITYNDNNTLLAIGNDWNGSGYNIGASLATHGKQDITKIYNRALTADEVTQNYRHYKTRFNLS